MERISSSEKRKTVHMARSVCCRICMHVDAVWMHCIGGESLEGHTEGRTVRPWHSRRAEHTTSPQSTNPPSSSAKARTHSPRGSRWRKTSRTGSANTAPRGPPGSTRPLLRCRRALLPLVKAMMPPPPLLLRQPRRRSRGRRRRRGRGRRPSPGAPRGPACGRGGTLP